MSKKFQLLLVWVAILFFSFGTFLFFKNDDGSKNICLRTWFIQIDDPLLQKALIEQWRTLTSSGLDVQELDDISTLYLQFEPHSIRFLDISELKKLPYLRRLTISPTLKGPPENFVYNGHRKWYVELTGLNQLSSLSHLFMHDFPIAHLDGADFPKSLQRLDLSAIGVKSFINRELLEKIPNVLIQLDVLWESEPYSFYRSWL